MGLSDERMLMWNESLGVQTQSQANGKSQPTANMTAFAQKENFRSYLAQERSRPKGA